jgi:hypothetical protein
MNASTLEGRVVILDDRADDPTSRFRLLLLNYFE